MRFDLTSAAVLSTLAVGQAVAASITPSAGKMHNHAARHAQMMDQQSQKRDLESRDTALISAADGAKLNALGIGNLGINAVTSGSTPWVGSDGSFTNTFHNQATQDLVLTVWGPAGSWVNAVKPHLTLSIPQGSSKTVSFPIGWSGAWAPIYSDTKLVNGQVFETWGEATFAPPYSVVDVSREVNLGGRTMSIVGPQCTTNMDTCVFKCAGGATTCMYNYELVNCATGSQPGANYGMYYGAPSGGCGGMDNAAKLNTYLG